MAWVGVLVDDRTNYSWFIGLCKCECAVLSEMLITLITTSNTYIHLSLANDCHTG
jgi:hypothetical protein